MLKSILRLFIFISILVFQLSSTLLSNLENSLVRFSKELRNLEYLLSVTPTVHPKTPPSQSIEKQILVYTNEFRAQNGKPPLQWNQKMAELATEHSENMALGRVPFGHAGFQDRVSRYPFRWKGAAENVFMATARSNIARVVVDGWINSPGHRQNLLGNYNYCGVGTYKGSQNRWYYTQLFGLS